MIFPVTIFSILLLFTAVVREWVIVFDSQVDNLPCYAFIISFPIIIDLAIMGVIR